VPPENPARGAGKREGRRKEVRLSTTQEGRWAVRRQTSGGREALSNSEGIREENPLPEKNVVIMRETYRFGKKHQSLRHKGGVEEKRRNLLPFASSSNLTKGLLLLLFIKNKERRGKGEGSCLSGEEGRGSRGKRKIAEFCRGERKCRVCWSRTRKGAFTIL